MRLGVEDEPGLRETVEDLLASVEWTESTNPLSEVAAAFYVAMKRDPASDTTQRDVADAAGVSTVTIRNNYQKYT